MRYIQAAVSDEDHKLFTQFAFNKDLTLSDLVETAVKEYISTKRKEEATSNEVIELEA